MLDLYVKTILQDFDLDLEALSSLKRVVGTLFLTPCAIREIGVANHSPYIGFFLIKSEVQMEDALLSRAVDEVDGKPVNWNGNSYAQCNEIALNTSRHSPKVHPLAQPYRQLQVCHRKCNVQVELPAKLINKNCYFNKITLFEFEFVKKLTGYLIEMVLLIFLARRSRTDTTSQ